MTNLDAMCRQMLDHHHELLAEAARRRLLSSNVPVPPATNSASRSWRVTVAAWLRRIADRLEPAADRPGVAMLRAVAHREISVDQALTLLGGGNGHHSAIL